MPKVNALTLLLTIFLLSTQATYATLVVDNTPWPADHSDTHPTPKSFSVKSTEKRPIFVFAFVHDDIRNSDNASLIEGHFLKWIKEIDAVAGRRVSVEFIRNTPPYTHYSYKGDSTDAYWGWATLAGNYRDAKNLPHNKTTKFLLLTDSAINGTFFEQRVLGVAGPGQPFGIASLTGQTVGHELGHMLTADHDNAEVQYNGWWCETFMRNVTPGLSNCHVYSEGNRERIRSYLSDTP